MLKLIRTDSSNTDFHGLVRELDADLQIRDGADHAFFAQFNKIDRIQHVVVAYFENVPVGCGAIKEFQEGVMEVKRMYVKPEFRGRRIATEVLKELEAWAASLNYGKCVLETGKKQPEAISLYKRNGYQLIPNYGQYAEVLTSVCFEKVLS
jgi:putative acetyltransferase